MTSDYPVVNYDPVFQANDNIYMERLLNLSVAP